MRSHKLVVTISTVGCMLLACGALLAQAPAVPASPPPADAAAFTKEQLEQLVAPIALYPDGLLTQTFMAATYPLQIVEAARFMEQNPDLKGDPLNEKAEGVRLGRGGQVDLHLPRSAQEDEREPGLDPGPGRRDARPADRAARRSAGHAQQGLRRRQEIESNDQVNVTVEQPDPAEPQIIVIESKDPEVVYVPQYAPATMYPGWGYPSYYYPGMYPYYPPGAGFWGFTAGVIVGGAIWGNCNWGWGGSDVNIDIDRNTNFNRNTNINGGNRVNANNRAGGNQSWQHNAANRKGVNYRDGATAQKYGGSGSSTRVSNAEARGRAQGTGATAGTRQAGAGTRDQARRRIGRRARLAIAPLRRIERVRLAIAPLRRIERARPEIAPARRHRAGAADRQGAAGDRAGGAAGSRGGCRPRGSRRARGSRDAAGSRQSASAGSRDAGAARSSSSSSRPSGSSSSRASFRRLVEPVVERLQRLAQVEKTARASSSRGSYSGGGGYGGGGSRGGGGMSRGGGGGRRR